MNKGAIAAVLAFAISSAGIFALAQQGIPDTQALAWRVEQQLVRLVPPTGTGAAGEPTWCGLTIRRLAHIAEFLVLGIAAAAVGLTLLGRDGRAFGAAAALCLAASLADEVHKRFVPGRHFDATDLLLDALGYGLALLLVAAVSTLWAAHR